MTRGVKVRLIAFLVLSAVGIVYVAGSYLGIVDRVLGRGLSIDATLPSSGGLFEGSEVTYRGVKIGKVSAMDVTPEGLRVGPRARGRHQDPAGLADVRAQPLGGRRAVPRLRAARRRAAVRQGRRRLEGDESSLPTSEELLLTQMNSLVGSVDGASCPRSSREPGTMFRGTANPLQRMVDTGTQFVDEAAANNDETITLLDDGPDRAADAGGPRAGHPHLRPRPRRPHRHAADHRQGPPHASCRAARRRSARSTRCSRDSSRRCRSSCPTWSPSTRC